MKYVLSIALALFAAQAAAQTAPKVDGVVSAGEYASKYTEPKSGVTLSWKVVGDTAYFAVTAKTDSWIGVGFDPTGDKKDGADMYMFTMDGGKLVAQDMTMTKKTGAPKLDTEEGGKDSISAKAAKMDGGNFTVEFSRKLNTGDKTDATLTLNKKAKVLLAVGGSAKLNKAHAKSNRGETEIVIK